MRVCVRVWLVVCSVVCLRVWFVCLCVWLVVCVSVFVFMCSCGSLCMRVCVVARSRFNLRSHIKDLGTACKFGGGDFSTVLRPHFCVACRRTLLDKSELGDSFMRMCGRAAALQAAVRNHTTGMRTLARLAVVVSAMFHVGGFCVACCRALLDKPELGASLVRLCGRVVAF